jgi:hypothetical protein
MMEEGWFIEIVYKKIEKKTLAKAIDHPCLNNPSNGKCPFAIILSRASGPATPHFILDKNPSKDGSYASIKIKAATKTPIPLRTKTYVGQSDVRVSAIILGMSTFREASKVKPHIKTSTRIR